MLLAAEALERGNPTRALEHLGNLGDGIDPVAWRLRAVALRGIGDRDRAELAARHGLALAPDDVGLRLVLADILAAQKRRAESETVLLTVLNQHPEYAPALAQYAWLLAGAGDPAGARQIMARLPGPGASADGDDAGLFALHGYVALVEGDVDAAERCLDTGLALEPEAPKLRLLRALVADQRSQSREASNHVLIAAQSSPDGVADIARHARFINHPLMAPMRLVNRIGAGRLWLAWLAVLFLLPRVWPRAPMLWIIGFYLSFAIYTWTAPFLLRRWMRSRGRL